jgi:hypothetical protein
MYERQHRHLTRAYIGINYSFNSAFSDDFLTASRVGISVYAPPFMSYFFNGWYKRTTKIGLNLDNTYSLQRVKEEERKLSNLGTVYIPHKHIRTEADIRAFSAGGYIPVHRHIYLMAGVSCWKGAIWEVYTLDSKLQLNAQQTNGTESFYAVDYRGTNNKWVTNPLLGVAYVVNMEGLQKFRMHKDDRISHLANPIGIQAEFGYNFIKKQHFFATSGAFLNIGVNVRIAKDIKYMTDSLKMISKIAERREKAFDLAYKSLCDKEMSLQGKELKYRNKGVALNNEDGIQSSEQGMKKEELAKDSITNSMRNIRLANILMQNGQRLLKSGGKLHTEGIKEHEKGLKIRQKELRRHKKDYRKQKK